MSTQREFELDGTISFGGEKYYHGVEMYIYDKFEKAAVAYDTESNVFDISEWDYKMENEPDQEYMKEISDKLNELSGNELKTARFTFRSTPNDYVTEDFTDIAYLYDAKSDSWERQEKEFLTDYTDKELISELGKRDIKELAIIEKRIPDDLWTIGISGSEMDGVYTELVQGSMEDVKKYLISLVKEDKNKDPEKWDVGSDDIGSIEEDEVGILRAYGSYVDYYMEYGAKNASKELKVLGKRDKVVENSQRTNDPLDQYSREDLIGMLSNLVSFHYEDTSEKTAYEDLAAHGLSDDVIAALGGIVPGNYKINMAVSGWFETEVTAMSREEAEQKAIEAYNAADFGRLSDIEMNMLDVNEGAVINEDPIPAGELLAYKNDVTQARGLSNEQRVL